MSGERGRGTQGLACIYDLPAVAWFSCCSHFLNQRGWTSELKSPVSEKAKESETSSNFVVARSSSGKQYTHWTTEQPFRVTQEVAGVPGAEVQRSGRGELGPDLQRDEGHCGSTRTTGQTWPPCHHIQIGITAGSLPQHCCANIRALPARAPLISTHARPSRHRLRVRGI